MDALNDSGPGQDRLTVSLSDLRAWHGPPLILFVGVSTSGSLAHRFFDHWAAALGQPWTLRGLDLPADTPTAAYQNLASAMLANPAVRGAVVTAHKLRLHRACRPLLSRQDPMADLIGEVNALVSGAYLAAHARDPSSLTQVLPGLVRRTGAATLAELDVLCLGAGGSAAALLLASQIDLTGHENEHQLAPRGDRPAQLTFADIDRTALDGLRRVVDRAGIQRDRVTFVHVAAPADADALVAARQGRALVINATGLGKHSAGSPVTDNAPFGPSVTAWDFNYRGPLTFLRQAAAKGSRTVDGWDYFLAGWAGALCAIADQPLTENVIAAFAMAAMETDMQSA